MKIVALFFAGVGIFTSRPAPAAFDPHYAKWAIVLHEFMVNRDSRTFVVLPKLRTHDRVLRDCLHEIEEITPAEYGQLSVGEKSVFAINAFNAAMVRFILDCPAHDSLKQCGHWYRRYTKMPFLRVLGKTYSMDEFRSDWIRYAYNDPRMLFVLFDGSQQTVPIPREPLHAETLSSQLETSERGFLKDRTRNFYDPPRRRIHLARMFKKFGVDFDASTQGDQTGAPVGVFKAYLAKFLADAPVTQAEIAEPLTVIEFEDADLRPAFTDRAAELEFTRPARPKAAKPNRPKAKP